MKAINFLLNLLIYMVLPFIFIFILSFLIGFSYYNVAQSPTFCVLLGFYLLFMFIGLCIKEDNKSNPLYFFNLKNK